MNISDTYSARVNLSHSNRRLKMAHTNSLEYGGVSIPKGWIQSRYSTSVVAKFGRLQSDQEA